MAVDDELVEPLVITVSFWPAWMLFADLRLFQSCRSAMLTS